MELVVGCAAASTVARTTASTLPRVNTSATGAALLVATTYHDEQVHTQFSQQDSDMPGTRGRQQFPAGARWLRREQRAAIYYQNCHLVLSAEAGIPRGASGTRPEKRPLPEREPACPG